MLLHPLYQIQTIFALLFFHPSQPAAASIAFADVHNVASGKLDALAGGRSLWTKSQGHSSRNLEKRAGINTSPNGSTFLWLTQDVYAGKTFFDRWDFFDYEDPTSGTVNFLNRSEAFRRNFTYAESNGTVVMKADMESVLPSGVNRDSIRIQSQARYNSGLFILDLTRAPWGCAIWPAFWTTNEHWPANGEIDIIEGVHDNQHNQIAWHTAPGCYLDPTLNFTGTIVSQSRQNCDATINNNDGCGVTEWSRASYGPYFESQGGGVIAMKWDEDGIAIWSFYRAAIPEDVIAGTPVPATWGPPSAILGPAKCNITKFFHNHTIVFDITFCGEWAGNSYAMSGCPGTCANRLRDPANFVNASWHINSLKVYKRVPFNGVKPTSDSVTKIDLWRRGHFLLLVTLLKLALLMW